jgi:1-acyl-sn-glycerol-3-phosphate acyltransferase
MERPLTPSADPLQQAVAPSPGFPVTACPVSDDLPAAPGTEVSALARSIASLRMTGFVLRSLAYVNCSALVRFRLNWLRSRGRADEAEAVVERMTRSWAQSAFQRLGCRVELSGQEHLPKEGPVLVLPNHQSLFDIPLLMGFLGRPVGFVFKRELLKLPGMRYWMLAIHCHAIDRAEHRTAVEQYDRFGEELKQSGRALVVFAEGTRTRDPLGTIGPFRRGALRLAGQQGIPLLPVAIDGTRFLVRPDRMAATPPGRRVVRMRFLPLRPTRPMSAPESKDFMDRVRNDIVSVWETMRVTWPDRGR